MKKEYFYILKNEPENTHYFGHTKQSPPSKRLGQHQHNGFKFTDYVIFETANARKTEEDFGRIIYWHQKETEAVHEYEKQYASPFEGAYHIKQIEPCDKHGARELIFNSYAMAFKYWKNGNGFSEIQSFEDQDLLEYLLSEEWDIGFGRFKDWIARRNKCNKMIETLAWTKEKKGARRKVFGADSMSTLPTKEDVARMFFFHENNLATMGDLNKEFIVRQNGTNKALFKYNDYDEFYKKFMDFIPNYYTFYYLPQEFYG